MSDPKITVGKVLDRVFKTAEPIELLEYKLEPIDYKAIEAKYPPPVVGAYFTIERYYSCPTPAERRMQELRNLKDQVVDLLVPSIFRDISNWIKK